VSAFTISFGLLSAWAVGTHVSLLTTHGSSMAPIFETGDLAVTTRADNYRVGDVVAYRTEPYGLMVLHRIRSFSDGRYSFKGDNNSFIDPQHPTRDKLVGKLAFRVPHAGFIVDWMTTRTRALLVLVGASLLVAGSRAVRKPRKHRKRRRRPPGDGRTRGSPPRSHVTPAPAFAPPSASPASAPPDLREVAVALGPPVALLVVLITLAAVPFSTPLTRTVSEKRSFTQAIKFDYHATAPKGAAYPDGVVRTGSPIFAKLVDVVELQARYRFSAGAQHHVVGTYSLDAEVSSGPWKQTVALQGPNRFSGDSFETGAPLDLKAMRSAVAAMAAETGTQGGINVSVVPDVKVNGTVDDVAFTGAYDTPLKLTLTPTQLTVDSAPKGDATHLGGSTTSSVRVSGTAVRSLSLLGRTMAVARARVMTAVGVLLALMWLAVAFVLCRRQRGRPRPDRIDRRFHSSMVQINNLPLMTNVVDVPTMATLARLAESGEMLILHYQRDGLHTYLVDDTNTVYRYRVADDVVQSDEDGEPTPATSPGPAAPRTAAPPTADGLPQSLSEAIRMRPLTTDEIRQFGVTDASADQDDATRF